MWFACIDQRMASGARRNRDHLVFWFLLMMDHASLEHGEADLEVEED